MIRMVLKDLLRMPPLPHLAMMGVGCGTPLMMALLPSEPGVIIVPDPFDMGSPLALSGLAIGAVGAVMASAHTLLVPFLALIAAIATGAGAMVVAAEGGGYALYGAALALVGVALAGTVLWQIRHPTQ